MATGGEKDRRHTRLFARGGTAHGFFGDVAARLPEKAAVLDVSEGGARIAFSAPAAGFPLSAGDDMGLHMTLTGAARELNVIAKVRRVEAFEDEGRVEVGLEFIGLGERERESIRESLQALALEKLKGLRTTPRDGLPPLDAAAPAAPAASPAAPGAPPSPPAPPGFPGAAARRPATPVPAGRAPQAPAAEEPAAEEPEAEESGGAPVKKKRRRKPYFGEILVKQGAITAERLDRFLESEFSGAQKLGEALRERGLIDEQDVAKALAEQARLRFIEIGSEMEIAKIAGGLPRLIFIEHRCIPVALEDGGKVLVVAMARPPALEDIEKLGQATSRRIRVAIATESDVDRCIEKLYNVRRTASTASIRHEVRLGVAYRFCNSEWTEYVGGPSCRGVTEDISRIGIGIVGPMPEGVNPERIRAEDLTLEVRARGLEGEEPIRIACRPARIDAADRVDLYTIGCRIEGFPDGQEAEWNRLIMRISMQGFKPRRERFS